MQLGFRSEGLIGKSRAHTKTNKTGRQSAYNSVDAYILGWFVRKLIYTE